MKHKKGLIIAGLIAAIFAPVLLMGSLVVGGAVVLGGIGNQSTSIGCVTTPGQLPATVPQPLNSILTQAATQWNTDPIALAVLYHNENGWTFDREPPQPYGNGRAWATSSAGASGPFQFLAGTYRGYQNANPASQPGNVLDLTDAAYAAAQFLSDLGGTVGTPLGDPANPSAKPTIVNALVSYHSGPAFKTLGPRGREYASRGFEAYKSLQLSGGLDGSVPTLESTSATPPESTPIINEACAFTPGTPTEGYPDTAGMSCMAGTDVGIHKTAKGNTIRICNVRGFTVNAAISAQVAAMLQAADADGLNLAGSGFRDMDRQIGLRKQNCGSSYYDIWEKPSRQCSPPTATPGDSQHEQGNAIDITSDGKLIRSQITRAFAWLKANAARFGLYNLPSEPWHWSADGR